MEVEADTYINWFCVQSSVLPRFKPRNYVGGQLIIGMTSVFPETVTYFFPLDYCQPLILSEFLERKHL